MAWVFFIKFPCQSSFNNKTFLALSWGGFQRITVWFSLDVCLQFCSNSITRNDSCSTIYHVRCCFMNFTHLVRMERERRRVRERERERERGVKAHRQNFSNSKPKNLLAKNKLVVTCMKIEKGCVFVRVCVHTCVLAWWERGRECVFDLISPSDDVLNFPG